MVKLFIRITKEKVLTMIKKRYFLQASFSFIFGCALLACQPYTKVPDTPPTSNPNPAKVEADLKRVAFAKKVISRILVESHLYYLNNKKEDPAKNCCGQTSPNRKQINQIEYNFDITEKCLENIDCVLEKLSAETQDAWIKRKYGIIQDRLHTHVVPWSFKRFQAYQKGKKFNFSSKRRSKNYTRNEAPVLQKDEYMIHSYVRFKHGVFWYHLNVIVAEDEDGNLEFRRFFIFPMQKKIRQGSTQMIC